jgi:hypothetical protein
MSITDQRFSPRLAALNALTNIKQKLSGTLRRQLLRNTGENIGAKTRPEPTDDAVRMSRRLSRATWAQLDKWIRRVNRRLPQIEKTLEDAKAAGLIRQVSMLQVKVDQLKFVRNGFTTEVAYRKGKMDFLAAAKKVKANEPTIEQKTP